MSRARLAALLGIVIAFGVTVGVYRRPVRVGITARNADRRCRGGCTEAPALYRSAGPFSPAVSITRPFASDATAWCISANLTAQADWSDNAQRGIFQLGATNGANNTLSFYRYSDTNKSILWVDEFNSGGAHSTFNSNGGSYPNGMLMNPTHQVSFCFDAGVGFSYIDGVQVATGALSSSITWPATIRLGDLGSGVNTYGAGISQICIAGTNGGTSGAPTADVKNSCGQFTNTTPALAERFACYGCLGSSPSGGATTVYALGDSLTAYESSVARPYPAKLNALLGSNYNVTNAGSAGDTVAGMKTRYEATARNWGRCIFLGGVNDVITNGSTAASTYTTASALLDEMRSDGCNPIILLPTPVAGYSSWSAPKQTQYNSYRSSLSGYCVTNSITCIETSVGLGNGSTPVSIAAAYDSGDGLHFNQAGADELATLASAGILALAVVLPGGPTPSQIAAGTLTASNGSSVSTARTSGKYVNTLSSGILFSLLANNTAPVDATGLYVEGQSTNIMPATIAMSGSLDGSGAVAPTDTPLALTDPLGAATTATRLAFPAVSTGGNFSVLWGSFFDAVTASTYTFSVYDYGVSGANTFYMSTWNPERSRVACTVTASTWTRCSYTFTFAGSHAQAAESYAFGADTRDGSQGAISAITTGLWGAQLEQSPFATSFSGADNGTTHTVRQADQVTMTNPMSGSSWCWGATIPAIEGTLANGGTRGILGMGTSAAANSASLSTSSSGIVFSVYDNAGAAKTITATPTQTFPYRVVACDISGTLTLYFNSTLQSVSSSGAGTGVLGSMPGTVGLGAVDASATSPLFGWMHTISFGVTAASIL